MDSLVLPEGLRDAQPLHQANELAPSHLGGLREVGYRGSGLSVRFPI